jgi:trans-aconitate methyltransferase
MLYKTIVLQFLQDHPQMYDRLIRQRMLLATLETCATQLKDSHETWKNLLTHQKPDSDPSQIASEALELALQELEDHLPSESAPEDGETLSLDQAMTFIRRHTPPA